MRPVNMKMRKAGHLSPRRSPRARSRDRKSLDKPKEKRRSLSREPSRDRKALDKPGDKRISRKKQPQRGDRRPRSPKRQMKERRTETPVPDSTFDDDTVSFDAMLIQMDQQLSVSSSEPGTRNPTQALLNKMGKKMKQQREQYKVNPHPKAHSQPVNRYRQNMQGNGKDFLLLNPVASTGGGTITTMETETTSQPSKVTWTASSARSSLHRPPSSGREREQIPTMTQHKPHVGPVAPAHAKPQTAKRSEHEINKAAKHASKQRMQATLSDRQSTICSRSHGPSSLSQRHSTSSSRPREKKQERTLVKPRELRKPDPEVEIDTSRAVSIKEIQIPVITPTVQNKRTDTLTGSEKDIRAVAVSANGREGVPKTSQSRPDPPELRKMEAPPKPAQRNEKTNEKFCAVSIGSMSSSFSSSDNTFDDSTISTKTGIMDQLQSQDDSSILEDTNVVEKHPSTTVGATPKMSNARVMDNKTPRVSNACNNKKSDTVQAEKAKGPKKGVLPPDIFFPAKVNARSNTNPKKHGAKVPALFGKPAGAQKSKDDFIKKSKKHPPSAAESFGLPNSLCSQQNLTHIFQCSQGLEVSLSRSNSNDTQETDDDTAAFLQPLVMTCTQVVSKVSLAKKETKEESGSELNGTGQNQNALTSKNGIPTAQPPTIGASIFENILMSATALGLSATRPVEPSTSIDDSDNLKDTTVRPKSPQKKTVLEALEEHPTSSSEEETLIELMPDVNDSLTNDASEETSWTRDVVELLTYSSDRDGSTKFKPNPKDAPRTLTRSMSADSSSFAKGTRTSNLTQRRAKSLSPRRRNLRLMAAASDSVSLSIGNETAIELDELDCLVKRSEPEINLKAVVSRAASSDRHSTMTDSLFGGVSVSSKEDDQLGNFATDDDSFGQVAFKLLTLLPLIKGRMNSTGSVEERRQEIETILPLEHQVKFFQAVRFRNAVIPCKPRSLTETLVHSCVKSGLAEQSSGNPILAYINGSEVSSSTEDSPPTDQKLPPRFHPGNDRFGARHYNNDRTDDETLTTLHTLEDSCSKQTSSQIHIKKIVSAETGYDDANTTNASTGHGEESKAFRHMYHSSLDPAQEARSLDNTYMSHDSSVDDSYLPGQLNEHFSKAGYHSQLSFDSANNSAFGLSFGPSLSLDSLGLIVKEVEEMVGDVISKMREDAKEEKKNLKDQLKGVPDKQLTWEEMQRARFFELMKDANPID